MSGSAPGPERQPEAPPDAGQGPRKPLRPARKGIRGRRKRRLRRTALSLTVVAVAALLGGWFVYRSSRPEIYRPGEEIDEITEKLSASLPADAPRPRLVDVTGAAGLDGFRTFAGERTSQLPEDMGSGLAWGDVDNDGDDDLFVVAAGGPLTASPAERAPSRLYVNQGDGTFRVDERFPELRIIGMGAAWGDYDADGWLDLAVSGYGTLVLFQNREGLLVPGPELPVPEGTGGYWAGVAWGDYDADRDLDLYVAGYVRYDVGADRDGRTSQQYGAAVPYTLNPASFEPERNLLFENRDGAFVEVAGELGVANPEGRSLSTLWHDFDADGRLDLYVANDISDNALYLNRDDGFEDASLAAWVADYRGAMGLAAGDWNRDGDDDLFITHWIAQENALYDSLLADGRSGDGGRRAHLGFTDRAAPLGLGQSALRFVGWGTEFADLDADGWLDLVVANGSTFETDEEPPRLKPQEPMLLWNRRGEYFHDLAPLAEPLAVPRVGRGLAVADYDLDGDLDVGLTHLDGGVLLLANAMQDGHWLEIRLVSRTADGEPRGFGDGSTVTVRAGEVVLRRSVTSASYLSQSSRMLHFGLGEATTIDAVEVAWLGGERELFTGLEADGRWELVEGEGRARRLGGGQDGVDREAETPRGDERQRIARFWEVQRAAMDAMKREGDLARAAELFRDALALDPTHEDARYYLANCLAALGRPAEALEHLARLQEANPQSHRAFKQWGVLRAMTATSEAELEAAREDLERALELNQEETGSLLVLGEIALMEGDPARADEVLALATRTNHRAVGGYFLRGYVAWKRGEAETAVRRLEEAHAARGEDWKPEGTVAEGEVARRMHVEESPLASFWQRWDGTPEPEEAYRALDVYLAEPFAGGESG